MLIFWYIMFILWLSLSFICPYLIYDAYQSDLSQSIKNIWYLKFAVYTICSLVWVYLCLYNVFLLS